MINLNLLPDIKKEYLRTQRVKRLFIAGSFLVSLVFVALVVLLASYVFGVQKLHLSRLQDDIDFSIDLLKSEPDLDKVVTIQNQLNALPGLHDGKPNVSALFSYLSLLVPKNVTLSTVDFDFEENIANITGDAKTVKDVNIFVDTLKNAKFSYQGQEGELNATEIVVVESIAVDNSDTDSEDRASYTLEVKFIDELFDTTLKDTKLSIPDITSSPSVTERPVLFNQASEDQQP